MTKLERLGIVKYEWRRAISCFFNQKQTSEDALTLQGQGLDQVKGESPTGGKPDFVGAS